ncbi:MULTISPECIES: LPS translocon maturation chaperone LptM [unclassified Psychrobacter]|uniref:LPS translocon maturation chaperone LptM n=1 Tax=unclassified Psychrobacter TaxID=196806 RepID=UPI0025D9572A|nr:MULTISPECIES: lipoprotein [unclassified Psychrobacter]
MFTIRRTSNFNSPNFSVVFKSSAIYKLIVATLVIGSASLVGCGQKGDLYLTEPSSQTVKDNVPALESSSHPQDAAFTGIDDDDYQKQRYLEQQQVLPEPSDDPNDY